MPLDPSIYNQVGKVNLGQGLGEALTGFADRQYRLADLARQQETQVRQGKLQDLQLRSGQRAEALVPAQQAETQRLAKQKHVQELAYGISQGLDPQHGIDKQTLQAMTVQEARNRGLGDEDIQQLFAPLASGRDDAALSQYYLQMANPQEAQKRQIESMYRKEEVVKPVFSPELGGYVQPPTKSTPTGRFTAIPGVAPREKADKLIAVIGDDGQTPILIPQSQAAGRTPVTSAGKGAASQKMTPQQLEQAALSAQQAIDQAAKIFSHPGKGVGTGMTSALGSIPGTDAYGFQANLETFKAQVFLPLVQALKGMGALSDAEGKKVSDSVGALKAGMKQSEFDANLKESTRFLFDKAKAAGLNVTLPEFAGTVPRETGGHPPDISGLLQKYGR